MGNAGTTGSDYQLPGQHLGEILADIVVLWHTMAQRAGNRGRTNRDRVETADHFPDRAQRMELYRSADRLVVVDHTLVLPLNYAATFHMLIKETG